MTCKPINIDDILEKNQHIDPKDLADSKALADELSRIGIQPRGYQLPPAFERRRATICDENNDPRVVNLSISRG